jgi:hypothetical protein
MPKGGANGHMIAAPIRLKPPRLPPFRRREEFCSKASHSGKCIRFKIKIGEDFRDFCMVEVSTIHSVFTCSSTEAILVFRMTNLPLFSKRWRNIGKNQSMIFIFILKVNFFLLTARILPTRSV